MRTRLPLLYFLLALLGLSVGPRLAELVRTPPALELDFGKSCERASISPDGRWVAGLLRTGDGWSVALTDLYEETSVDPIPVPDPPARAQTFAWHSSSRWLAFGCHGEVRVLDLQRRTWQVLRANPMVRQVLFRGDILLARADDRILLWNIKSGKQTLRLDAPHVLHADLSLDGKTLALGCFGEGVRLMALPSKKVVKHLAPGLTPAALSFCHGDRWIAAALKSGNPLEDQSRLFDVPSGRQLGPSILQANLRGMAVSADGHRLLLRSDELASVWEPSSGNKIAESRANSTLIDALSPDGKLVASTPPGKAEVTLWSAESGDVLQRLDHPRIPSQLNFSGANRLEVVGDRYRLWWIR